MTNSLTAIFTESTGRSPSCREQDQVGPAVGEPAGAVARLSGRSRSRTANSSPAAASTAGTASALMVAWMVSRLIRSPAQSGDLVGRDVEPVPQVHKGAGKD